MEVRIRNANDSTSRTLADIPFRPDVIDSVIPTIGGWGVADSAGRLYDTDQIVGQFVDDGEKAYFEIVLGGDDE